jgi:hypothetical protein
MLKVGSKARVLGGYRFPRKLALQRVFLFNARRSFSGPRGSSKRSEVASSDSTTFWLARALSQARIDGAEMPNRSTRLATE